MRYLFIVALTLLLSSCGDQDWQELRKENLDKVKASCASSGGSLTITYEVSTFTSTVRVTCSYPNRTDPVLDIQP